MSEYQVLIWMKIVLVLLHFYKHNYLIIFLCHSSILAWVSTADTIKKECIEVNILSAYFIQG